jgi:hypothetical protein
MRTMCVDGNFQSILCAITNPRAQPSPPKRSHKKTTFQRTTTVRSLLFALNLLVKSLSQSAQPVECARGLHVVGFVVVRWAVPALKDKPAQVFILREGVEAQAHLGLVDGDVSIGPVGGVEAEVFEDALEDRVQPPRADVLG